MKTEKTMQKEIKFYEDTLLGVQVENGDIYLAVKKTAMNIGLTEDQARGEIRKLQESELFKMNCVKFNTLQNEGIKQVSRESVFLLEKYVPMWLAQINITPKMRLQNPEASTKLITYQIKCVEILHEAFMGDESKKKDFYDSFDIKVVVEKITENMINKVVVPLQSEIIHLKDYINEKDIINTKTIQHIKDSVSNFNNMFKLSPNKSAQFEKLRLNFLSFRNADVTSYAKFYQELSIWFGHIIHDQRKVRNTKQWVINNMDMSQIEEFVNGVIIKRIVKNGCGQWIDLNGVNCNTIEFNRIIKEFNGECAYCGKITDNLLIEHIIPQGNIKSSDLLENVVCSCPDCNYDKYDKDFETWYKSYKYFSPERYDRIVDHCFTYQNDKVVKI